jgi:hypothetical protein
LVATLENARVKPAHDDMGEVLSGALCHKVASGSGFTVMVKVQVEVQPFSSV